MKFNIAILPFLFVVVQSATGQGNKIDRFHIPMPIKFENSSYYLSDSYHPESYYYKQEYIPKGESADHFNSMVTIDVVIADVSVKDVVDQKINEIQAMQKTDPIVKYELMEHPEKGEYMLDFLMSQTVDGRVLIVEWNLYRYKVYTTKSGKKGVLLFAYSLRGYEGKTKDFLISLKTKRPQIDKSMGEYKLPDFQISD